MGENKWFICSYQVYKNMEFLNIVFWFLYLEHGIKSCLTPAKCLNADTVFIARYYYYNGSSENTTPLQLLFITLEALDGRGCCCCRGGSPCSRLAGVGVWAFEHWKQEWVPGSLLLPFSFPEPVYFYRSTKIQNFGEHVGSKSMWNFRYFFNKVV